jgi:hypothetical protein
MKTGASFGLFLGLTSFVFLDLAPQPAGQILWFGFWSVQVSWGAVTYWRRTRLPFMTAALVLGAVMSCCLTVLAAIGRPLGQMSAEAWVLVVGTMVTGLLLIHIESRVNKSKVKQCAEYREHTTVWGALTFRHIPHLREGGN